jgi:hypothetical protein
MMMFGFKVFMKDGYIFYFFKWELKNGNSLLGKNRVKDVFFKGVIMPKGIVRIKMNGKDMDVLYIFKAYQNMELKFGMIRTFFIGAYAPTPISDCEFLKVTKSITVVMGVPCFEVICLIK